MPFPGAEEEDQVHEEAQSSDASLKLRNQSFFMSGLKLDRIQAPNPSQDLVSLNLHIDKIPLRTARNLLEIAGQAKDTRLYVSAKAIQDACSGSEVNGSSNAQGYPDMEILHEVQTGPLAVWKAAVTIQTAFRQRSVRWRLHLLVRLVRSLQALARGARSRRLLRLWIQRRSEAAKLIQRHVRSWFELSATAANPRSARFGRASQGVCDGNIQPENVEALYVSPQQQQQRQSSSKTSPPKQQGTPAKQDVQRHHEQLENLDALCVSPEHQRETKAKTSPLQERATPAKENVLSPFMQLENMGAIFVSPQHRRATKPKTLPLQHHGTPGKENVQLSPEYQGEPNAKTSPLQERGTPAKENVLSPFGKFENIGTIFVSPQRRRAKPRTQPSQYHGTPGKENVNSQCERLENVSALCVSPECWSQTKAKTSPLQERATPAKENVLPDFEQLKHMGKIFVQKLEHRRRERSLSKNLSIGVGTKSKTSPQKRSTPEKENVLSPFQQLETSPGRQQVTKPKDSPKHRCTVANVSENALQGGIRRQCQVKLIHEEKCSARNLLDIPFQTVPGCVVPGSSSVPLPFGEGSASAKSSGNSGQFSCIAPQTSSVPLPFGFGGACVKYSNDVAPPKCIAPWSPSVPLPGFRAYSPLQHNGSMTSSDRTLSPEKALSPTNTLSPRVLWETERSAPCSTDEGIPFQLPEMYRSQQFTENLSVHGRVCLQNYHVDERVSTVSPRIPPPSMLISQPKATSSCSPGISSPPNCVLAPGVSLQSSVLLPPPSGVEPVASLLPVKSAPCSIVDAQFLQSSGISAPLCCTVPAFQHSASLSCPPKRAASYLTYDDWVAQGAPHPSEFTVPMPFHPPAKSLPSKMYVPFGANECTSLKSTRNPLIEERSIPCPAEEVCLQSPEIPARSANACLKSPPVPPPPTCRVPRFADGGKLNVGMVRLALDDVEQMAQRLREALWEDMDPSAQQLCEVAGEAVLQAKAASHSVDQLQGSESQNSKTHGRNSSLPAKTCSRTSPQRRRLSPRQSPRQKPQMKSSCDMPLPMRSWNCRPSLDTVKGSSPSGRSASAGHVRPRCPESARRSCVDELLSTCKKINNIDGLIIDADRKASTEQVRTNSVGECKTSIDSVTKTSASSSGTQVGYERLSRRPASTNRKQLNQDLQGVRNCQSAASMHTIPGRSGKEAAPHSSRDRARPWRPN